MEGRPAACYITSKSNFRGAAGARPRPGWDGLRAQHASHAHARLASGIWQRRSRPPSIENVMDEADSRTALAPALGRAIVDGQLAATSQLIAAQPSLADRLV